jgi:transposase
MRRKFSREFKIEAVRLVTDRGVAMAQAARDLDVAESVLRRWMRELASAPVAAFPGNGQMRADLAEIAALKKEVARLRAERDILKIGEPCAPLVRAQWRRLVSHARRHEVRLHRQASSHLARQLAVRRAGCVAVGLPCLAQSSDQPPRDP